MKTSRIGDRILVSTSGERWVATVSGSIPDWQRQSLELWMGAWIALGAMLLYGAWAFPGSERNFYLICLGFWSFFAVRAWRAVRWRRSGHEVIQLSQDGVELRLDHGDTPGRATTAPLAVVQEAQPQEPNPKSFFESMEQQFWVVGGDRIHLSAGPKTLVFGKQLPPEDAAKLAQLFNQRLKRLKAHERQALTSVMEDQSP